MSTQTPQTPDEQALLEAKLKLHIEREFDLGEKVIGLLKQKKELETSLQYQLATKTDLEQQLQSVISNKQGIEEKFTQLQQELRTQQKSLRQRSRRFEMSAEDSRENLETLREEIHGLKEQLGILDIQKVEDHMRLSNTIETLSSKERHLKQELQKLSYQKELAEEELEVLAQQFQKLSEVHGRERNKHEQEIEQLQRKQAQSEIRLAHLLDEQKRNERKLQDEVDALRLSKTQLEEKIVQLEQRPEKQPEMNILLAQQLKQKERQIQELQTLAHQRSALLRAENENLRREVAHMTTVQEKMTQEHQTLESSLKNVEQDLVIAKRVKQKRQQPESQPMPVVHPSETQAPQTQPPEKPISKKLPVEEKTQRIRPTIWPKWALAGVLLLVVGLGAAWTVSVLEQRRRAAFPQYVQHVSFELPANNYGIEFNPVPEITGSEEFPSIPAELAEPELTSPSPVVPVAPTAAATVKAQPTPLPPQARVTQPAPVQTPRKTVPPTPVPTPRKTAQPKPVPTPRKTAQPAPRATQTPKPSSQPTQRARPLPSPKPSPKAAVRTVHIMVKLPSPEERGILPKEYQTIPTIDNNSILRRYYQQKHLIGYDQ